MKTLMKLMIKKAFDMSETERCLRVIELSVKQHKSNLEISDVIEMNAIQLVRELTGEIDKVKQSRMEV
jgi:hypothetical protein